RLPAGLRDAQPPPVEGLLPRGHLLVRGVVRGQRLREGVRHRRRHDPAAARGRCGLHPADDPDGGLAVNRRSWVADVAGLAIAAVLAFPVYWMVVTAFKP